MYSVGRQVDLFFPAISAYIIYMHPQLRTDPDKERATLLRVILREMDRSVFGGQLPQAQKWFAPPHTVVAPPALLHLSFAATMVAALSSVSVKRMLNVYTFYIRMQFKGRTGNCLRFMLLTVGLLTQQIMIFMSSLLLLLACFTSSCSLVVYLWKVNLAPAPPVLMLTICIVLILLSLYRCITLISYVSCNVD